MLLSTRLARNVRSRAHRALAGTMGVALLAAGITAVGAVVAAPAQALDFTFPPQSVPQTCAGVEGGTITCTYTTGQIANLVIPAGVTSVTITATGGAGQNGFTGRAFTFVPCSKPGGVGGAGGRGARTVTTLPVLAGETLAISVGGSTTPRTGGPGGQGQRLNEGTENCTDASSYGANGGSGGAASVVSRNGVVLAIASGGGGGGGGGACTCSPGAAGGDAGAAGSGAKGASGGAAGGATLTPGIGGTGGNDQRNSSIIAAGGGGGGGGGWAGGGGGKGGDYDGGAGGGGGSSYSPGGTTTIVDRSTPTGVVITYFLPDDVVPTVSLQVSSNLGQKDGYYRSATLRAFVSDPSGATTRCVLLPAGSPAPASYDALPGAACAYVTARSVGDGWWDFYAAGRDSVGNTSAVASKRFAVDGSGPVIDGTVTTVDGANGWLRSVKITYACTDSPAGVGLRKVVTGYGGLLNMFPVYGYVTDCPSPATVPDGLASTAPTVSSTDSIGNTSYLTEPGTWKIDSAPPKLDVQGGPAYMAFYEPGEVPTAPTCTATDGLSGMDGDCVVTGWSTTAGLHSISIRATDLAGNTAEKGMSYVVMGSTTPPADTTSPVITTNVPGGWSKDPVTLRWTVTDPESAFTIDDGCQDVDVTTDSPLTTYRCSASNATLASQSLVLIGVDRTPPDLAAVGGPDDGAAYEAGAVPSAPSCEASDALSGMESCQVLGYSTAVGSHNLRVVATDKVGNDTIVTRDYVVRDVTPPVITASVASTPTDAGWFSSGVQVVFDVVDPESSYGAFGDCDPPFVAAEGITYLTCSAESQGGAASRTVELKIDSVAPTVDFGGGPDAESLFFVGDVPPAPVCVGTDGASGIASCTITGWAADAGGHTMTATATDNAGNTTRATSRYFVMTDREGPEIVRFVDGPVDGATYYSGQVPAEPTCSGADSESGFDFCVVTGWSDEPGDHTMTATAHDRSGNTSTLSRSYTVRADTTGPTIQRSLSPALPASGWYRSPVSLSWAVTDAESQSSVVSDGCAAVTVSANRAKQAYACSATSDGGSASDTVTFGYDATRPLLAPSAVSGVLAVGQSAPVVTPGASDALSGVAPGASCSAVTTSSVGVRTVTCQAADNAGNAATAAVGYSVSDAFLGYASPLPKSSIKAGSNIPVRFELGRYGGGATRVTTATVRVSLATSTAAVFSQGSSVACPYVAKAQQYQCSLKSAKRGTYFLQTWEQVGTTGGGTAWLLAANAAAVVGAATANGGAVVVR